MRLPRKGKRVVSPVWITFVIVAHAFHAGAQNRQQGSAQAELETEARAFAQRYWNKLLRKCADQPRGDSYFYYGGSDRWRVVKGEITIVNDNNGGPDLPISKFCCLDLVEMKGVSVLVDRGDKKHSQLLLSAADKLNGITWKSESRISVQAYRQRWQRSEDRGWDPWGQWKVGDSGLPGRISFVKIKGKWEVPKYELNPDELVGMPGCEHLQSPVPALAAYQLSQLLVVDDPEGIRYVPIHDPVLISKIDTGPNHDDCPFSTLGGRNCVPFSMAMAERLPKNTEVRVLRNRDNGELMDTLVTERLSGQDFDFRGLLITVPQTGVWGAISRRDYSALRPKVTGPDQQMSDFVSWEDDRHMLVVSGEGVRFSSVSVGPRDHLRQFRFELDKGTLPPGTVLTPLMDIVGSGDIVRVGTVIEGVGNSYLFRALNRDAGIARDVLIPLADLKRTTNAPKQ